MSGGESPGQRNHLYTERSSEPEKQQRTQENLLKSVKQKISLLLDVIMYRIAIA